MPKTNPDVTAKPAASPTAATATTVSTAAITAATSTATPATTAPATAATTAPAAAAGPHRRGRNRRSEPNPLGGNFILMPSLLEYLSPDLTLPEQYFYRQRNDDGMGAEKALMYAVLKDGIRCFYKHIGATRRKYRKMSAEAEEWLMEDTYDYAFSFRVICDTLSIDADCLRNRLVSWKEFELERRESTGDTTSVQVGRSPFPTYFDEKEDGVAASSLTFKQIEPAAPKTPAPTQAPTQAEAQPQTPDSDEDIIDEAATSAGTDVLLEDSSDVWNDVEHVSLDDLALEEVA